MFVLLGISHLTEICKIKPAPSSLCPTNLLVELIYQSFLILDLLVAISAEDIGSACYQSFFHLLICVGWTSNRIANSAMVSSPFMASMATRALNSGLCFLRFCFNFLLLFILFILGAELYLNNLSSFWGPPHIQTKSLGFRGDILYSGMN